MICSCELPIEKQFIVLFPVLHANHTLHTDKDIIGPANGKRDNDWEILQGFTVCLQRITYSVSLSKAIEICCCNRDLP